MYGHTAESDADVVQVATGGQLLEESDALLHALRRHGVLRAASNETLLVVYGPQHTMRYRTLVLACALGNVHALFLPLYHNLEEALIRLLRQRWSSGAAQPRVAVLAPGPYAPPACMRGVSLVVATSGAAPPGCGGAHGARLSADYPSLLESGRAAAGEALPQPSSSSAAFFAVRQSEHHQPTFVIVPWAESFRFARRAGHAPQGVSAADATGGRHRPTARRHTGELDTSACLLALTPTLNPKPKPKPKPNPSPSPNPTPFP